jgi:hypothetical protein
MYAHGAYLTDLGVGWPASGQPSSEAAQREG